MNRSTDTMPLRESFPNTLYKAQQMEEPTITTRPNSSAFLLINSRDRYYQNGVRKQNTDTIPLNNFILNTGQQLSQGHFTRLAVTEVQFPYAIPNVNPYNHYLTVAYIDLSDSSTEIYTIQILDGFYNIVNLADVVENALNSDFPLPDGELWELTPNSVQQIFSNPIEALQQYYVLTTSDPARFAISIIPTPDKDKDPEGQGKNMDLRRMMGFVGKDYQGANFIVPTDTKFGNYNSLQYTSYIDIVSRKLTNYQGVRDNETSYFYNNVLHRVILDNTASTKLRPVIYDASGNASINSYGGNEMYWTGPFNVYQQIQVPKYINWSPGQYIYEVDLTLYDDEGNVLYVPNGAPDYLITLHLTEN
jgi:hypothetical protein